MHIRTALPTSLALFVACGDPAATTTETETDTSTGSTDTADSSTTATETTSSPPTTSDGTSTSDGPTTTDDSTSTSDGTTTEDSTTTGEPVDTTTETGETTTLSTSTGPDTTTDTTTDTTDSSSSSTGDQPPDLDALLVGLDGAVRVDYLGGGDGGIEHSSYWGLVKGSEDYNALPAAEQKKVDAMKASVLHSAQRVPTSQTPGVEVTGALTVEARTQELVLAVPTDYNGRLVVLGTPGTRDQWSSHGVLLSWLVARGYAVVIGNKGMTNGGVDGNATMLNKQHPSQHWGAMVIDLGLWASERLTAAYGEPPAATYAAGLSNGGYQVRRALELDRLRVLAGEPAVFAGGLDWAGVYWPDARVLDQNADDVVSPAELAAGDHLIRTNEAAAATMRYAYDPLTETTPANFAQIPPYPGAQAGMQAAGFDPASATIWGAYNTAFDFLKGFGLPQYKGVGYYNFTGYVFRAELMGHDVAEAAAYSCYTGPNDEPPALYAWLDQAQDGGFTAEHVEWALKNATTGEFSAPLISVHGDGDGLNGLGAHALSYRAAVSAFGTPSQHRLYVVSHGGHVDAHSDGLGLDFDFDGTSGEEGAADRFVLMQPYAERAFLYLVEWVEAGVPAPIGKTLATDPANDVLEAEALAF